MINIIPAFLTINPYSRCGKSLAKVQAIVIHWLQNPKQTAMQCRNFFELRKAGKLNPDGSHDFGSAHYIVDLNGNVIQCMPELERAFHCGSSRLDPANGKHYTDIARGKFGKYAIDYIDYSPNLVTIGVEHCHLDLAGCMSSATKVASIELVATLCKRYQLDPTCDILLHKEIVGWKDCHKWFVDHADDWQAYKVLVKNKMQEIIL